LAQLKGELAETANEFITESFVEETITRDQLLDFFDVLESELRAEDLRFFPQRKCFPFDITDQEDVLFETGEESISEPPPEIDEEMTEEDVLDEELVRRILKEREKEGEEEEDQSWKKEMVDEEGAEEEELAPKKEEKGKEAKPKSINDLD